MVIKGQIIVLDKTDSVVAVITDKEIVEKKGYRIVLDKNENYNFVDGGYDDIKITPRKVSEVEEEFRQACMVLVEYLKSKHHPYSKIEINQDEIKITETVLGIPSVCLPLKN